MRARPEPSTRFHAAFGRLLAAQPPLLEAEGVGFAAWASRHRLAPYAWYLASGVDPALADLLRAARTTASAQHLARAVTLEPVLRALADAGVRTIAFKGLGVAHAHYPSPGLRPLGDVDLLFSSNEIDRAVAVLEAMGFESDSDPMIVRFNREVRYNFPLRHPALGLLEAHHALYEDCAEAFTARVLRRVQPVTVLGVGLSIPAVDDLFLVLATHWGSSSPGALWVWLLDLALLGQRLTRAEWRSLAETAREYGLEIFVVAALTLLEQLWAVRFSSGDEAYALPRYLTVMERRALAALVRAVASGRVYGSGLCLARRMSLRPTRRGAAWLGDLLWPHPGAICVELGVKYSPSTIWRHRFEHFVMTGKRRFSKYSRMALDRVEEQLPHR